jgi:hypothetical protein
VSDKPFNKLNVLDQQLRRATPVGMRTETDVTIQKICGFELFNTRPYHNYETWSTGYVVEGQGVRVSCEDLDDAVGRWCRVVEALQDNTPLGYDWQYLTDKDAREQHRLAMAAVNMAKRAAQKETA